MSKRGRDNPGHYDDQAADLAAEFEARLLELGPPLHPIVRRCNAIRRAIEMHVEHPEPEPPSEILDLLFRALIAEAHLLDPDRTRGLEDAASALRTHVELRSKPPPKCSR